MSLLGSITGGLLDTGAQMAFNAHESRAQRKWLEKMSNTAHRREVEDLRLAGLNPILSAGGSGASTPGGGVAGASLGNLSSAVTKGLQTSAAVKQLKETTREVTAQADQSEVRSELVQNAKDWLEKNPQYKEAVYGSVMADMAGLPNTVGAATGVTGKMMKFIKDAWKSMEESTKKGGSLGMTDEELSDMGADEIWEEFLKRRESPLLGRYHKNSERKRKSERR